MASLGRFLFSSFLLTCLASSSTIVSNEMLLPYYTCSVDFESKNYTILTSRCKGPRFPPLACCNALKDFACTYADAINDMTADCAAIMFSYMNLYGGYPPGLLANMCSEGKPGLNCTNVKEEADEKTQPSNRVNIAATQSTLLMISATLLILLFHWL